MAENLMISHGEPQWDTKYNKLVTAVQNLGGVVDNLNWTDFTDDGIVYQNGFQNIGGRGAAGTGYRYLKIGGAKIVELQVSLHLMTDPGQSTNLLTALTVPGDIAPLSTGGAILNSDKYGMGLTDGRLDVSKYGGSTSWWTGSGSYYMMHIVYTAH